MFWRKYEKRWRILTVKLLNALLHVNDEIFAGQHLMICVEEERQSDYTNMKV